MTAEGHRLNSTPPFPAPSEVAVYAPSPCQQASCSHVTRWHGGSRWESRCWLMVQWAPRGVFISMKIHKAAVTNCPLSLRRARKSHTLAHMDKNKHSCQRTIVCKLNLGNKDEEPLSQLNLWVFYGQWVMKKITSHAGLLIMMIVILLNKRVLISSRIRNSIQMHSCQMEFITGFLAWCLDGAVVICRGIGGMLRVCNTDPFLPWDLTGFKWRAGGVGRKKD